MKKIIFIALVIIVCTSIVFIIPGCKEPEVIVETVTETVIKTVTETAELEESEYGLEPGEIAVIRFVNAESDPPTFAVLMDAISEFEAIHPNVKVQMELVADLLPYYAVNIAGGNAPDIGQATDTLAVKYAEEEIALTLDDVIEDMGGENEFIGSLLKKYKGHFYSMPWSTGGPVFWVRKDLFDKYNVKIPETMDEWIEAAEKLTLDTDNDGSIDIYGTCFPAGKNRMTEIILSIFIWQQGQTVVDADGVPHFDSEYVIKAIENMGKLAEFAPPGVGDYSYYDMTDAYASGRVASSIYWGRMISHIDMNAPELLPVTQAVSLPSNGIKATFSGADLFVVFKDSKYPEIAKDFLQFLVTGDRIARILLSIPGHIAPVTKTAAAEESYWEDEFVKANMDNIEICFEAPTYGIDFASEPGATVQNGVLVPLEGAFNTTYSIYEAQRIMAQAVQKHIIEGLSPEDAAKWGQAEIDKLMAIAEAENGD